MTSDESNIQEPDPDSSPFELAPIEGIPFDKDSEEARAIERILAWPEPDRKAAKKR